MNNVEIYAQAIADSIAGSSAQGVTSWDDPEFGRVACKIVEPVIGNAEASEEYFEYMETDADNWANWIAQTFGEDWGRVARVVAEEGY